MWVSCIVVMGVVLVAGAVLVAEDKQEGQAETKQAVQLSQAAENAIKAAFPQATIGEVEKKNDIFSVMLMDENYEKEVGVTPDGRIVAVSTKVKEVSPSGGAPSNQEGRVSQANCPPQDPNKPSTVKIDEQNLCPGNLVCMTYFCGGSTGCPYVCCPRGLPYLNHCDCKCYSSSEFECKSYSKCEAR